MYSIGIDIGGTFTDIVFWDEETGDYLTQKVLTTPQEPHVGVLEGFDSVFSRGSVSAQQPGKIIHATTLASNAIIERRGVKTAFVTTKGFRDVLELARGRKPVLYDAFYARAEPLVPRRLCFQVTERLSSDGRVLTPLAEDEVRLLVKELSRQGVEAVAICFLHSYRDSEHELRAGSILKNGNPNLFVSLSCEVAPEIREYERASTTVANAYLQPVMGRYLSELTRGLGSKGFGGTIYVMLSSGGITTVETVDRFPIRAVESGPAAGVMAAAFIGSLVGQVDLLCLDMGGTTAKISVVNGGRPTLASDIEVARVYRFKKGSGIPLMVPSVELVEIGAGGGSIAHVDKYGLLSVGPQSAESMPGPACYNLGGEEPTVTDADLLLGYLDPAYFLGGKMRLNEERARMALLRRVANPLHIDETQAAWGIYQVVNSSMVSATQVYAAEKGIDLRRLSLLAFGGAGPVHGCAVAEQLGIRKIIVPFGAGLASAFGLLVTPPAFDFVKSYVGSIKELDWTVVQRNYDEMEEEGRKLLGTMGIRAEEMELLKAADMRYLGQSHEITVSLPSGNPLEIDFPDKLEEAFNQEYEKIFRQANRGFAVEALKWRASLKGPRPQINIGELRRRSSTKRTLNGGKRRVYFPDCGGSFECFVFDRYSLEEGFTFSGPAIIEEVECTTVVRPGWEVMIDRYLNLVLSKD
jgi:N-methylhydantoinase A